MSKSHRDFVVFVKNGVEINALVAISQDVTTPATQEQPAVTIEHLTLVYLDPTAASQRPTGDQLRSSIKLEFDVAPLVEGKITGWKDVVSSDVRQVEPIFDGSGSERWGSGDSWTDGHDKAGWPVPAGSASDVHTKTASGAETEGQLGMYKSLDETTIGPDGKTDKERGLPWGSAEHLKAITASGPKVGSELDMEFVGSDPEAFRAFQDGRKGKEPKLEQYSETLRKNAADAHGFPSGAGQDLSGHGPNPPADPFADPSKVDNPAPSSPKDQPAEKGDVVGEKVSEVPPVGLGGSVE